MTRDHAGKIDRAWLHGARCNEVDGDTVESWFERAGNWKRVEIGRDRTVCVWGGRATWLTQKDIDGICRRIDQGV